MGKAATHFHDAFASREPVPTSLAKALALDAFALREPVPTSLAKAIVEQFTCDLAGRLGVKL